MFHHDEKESSVINNFVVQKQALEIRLAWELLEVFNDPDGGLISELRKMVKRSIDMMAKIAKDPQYAGEFQRNWIKDWRKYACCNEKGITDWHPGDIWFKSRLFDAQDCADWIRIFGEVLEKVTRGPMDMRRKDYQSGDKYYWTKYKPGDLKNGYAGLGLLQQDAGRRRLTDEDIKVAESSGQPIPSMGNYQDRQTPVWGFQASATPFAGLKKWRIMENDTTSKMDQVFGLTPGATISGTTADNIYFIKTFGTVGVHPVFYLLPLATIVSQGHHTLLECALPLTEVGVNEYKVGLYSTLFPIKTGADEPPGAERIKNILRIAENHRDNRLMLLYFGNRKTFRPVGCFDFDRDEWQGIITGERLMEQFRALRPWPNRESVENLQQRLGISVHRSFGAPTHA